MSDEPCAIYKCPKCKHTSDSDDFDCMGSTGDKVFCPKCGREVEAILVDQEPNLFEAT